MSIDLSPSERAFIAAGIAQNVRNDGRQRLDYRYFGVETGVIPHANGSCQFRLDTTDILVGVNAELSEPSPLTPNAGLLSCSVECTSTASSDYEGSGAQSMNVTLTAQLESILCSGVLDLEKLCVVPGKSCWHIYVDALVLDSAGNLLDAIVLAARAALLNTTIPKVTVVPGEREEHEIEVDDDPYECVPLDASAVPVCISMTKVGEYFVADASLEEEQCMAARLSVAVNAKGEVCGVRKSGQGSLAPSALLDMIGCAQKTAKDLIARLETASKAAPERFIVDLDQRLQIAGWGGATGGHGGDDDDDDEEDMR